MSFSRGAGDDLRAVAPDPVDAVVRGLARLPGLGAGGGQERRLVQSVAGAEWELAAGQPAVQGPGHVIRVELGANSDAGEVDRPQPMREQRALETDDIPAEDLVAAGHGEEPLPGQHPVPGLHPVLGVGERHCPHPGLDLAPQLASVALAQPPRVPRQQVSVLRLLLVQGEYPEQIICT